jgi:hypothetical protein
MLFKQAAVTLILSLLIPGVVLADHVPTQTPYDISIACDADGDTTKGDITVTWQESDGFESSPPERYAIAFSNDNFVETNYAVANSTGWEEALSYKSYVFTASYRETIFGTTADTFYAKVRADNDTDASYSEWTSVVSIDCDYGSTTTTTTTIPPAVPDDATNVSVNYQGKDVYFAWEYTDGNTLVNEFHINYSYDNSIWDRVIITDTTARTYTLDYTNIQTGTFYWAFSVCGDIENGESCTDSDSNNFETYQYVAPTTTVYVAPPPPPPPPPTPEEIIVDVKVEGVDKTYTQADVNDGTIERDQERVDNEKEYGCFMTDAQIERGDCDIPEEEPIEEVIIIEDEEKYDTKEEFSDDDDVVLDLELEDEVEELEPVKEEIIIEEETKIDIEKIEKEFEFEDEIIELPEEIIIEEVIEDELDQEILRDDKVREDEVPIKDEEIQEEIVEDTLFKQPVVELTDEEVAIEVAEVEEIIEDIVIEEVTTEEVIEVIQQVNDIGVQNLDQATEEVQEVVQAVVEEAIENVEDLTVEQVSVVAEVLQVEEDDVEIIAEAVKDDEVIAEAVEEYVQRAVDNADVENYTLADVVTEKTYEAFLENPIETFVDLDFEGITINNIGDDMTQDQKEKAQEVVVPVILTRIATMAAFVFRRSL